MEEVRFRSGGEDIAADLYLPANLAPGERRPALVIGHGFSSVKEQLVTQGERFSEAGYVVLAIDYRSFGRSSGEPRGQLFPLNEVEDYRNAISYLETRSEVEPDRIGVWGTSFAGGVVLAVAAVDRRVKACISQVPIVNPREWMQWVRTPDQWLALLDALEEDRRRRFRGEPGARIASSLRFGSQEPSALPCDDVLADLGSVMEEAYPSFRNEITLESLEKIIEFNPSATIAEISPRPLLMIGVTGYETLHPQRPILEAFHRAREPKRLALLPYDQLGVYVEPGSSEAIGTALDFLAEFLPINSRAGGEVPRTALPNP